jgi:hypothetical protein
MKYEIRLFPDTGHHYYFVPLALGTEAASITGSKIEEFKKQNKLTDQAQLRELQALTGSSAWEAFDASKLWLRARYGTKKVGNPPIEVFGLWVAIETNTGTSSDGYCCYVNERPPAYDRDFQEWLGTAGEDQATPYVAKDPLRIDHAAPVEINLNDYFPLDRLAGPEPRILSILWIKEGGEDVEVDLVVDFGNSRTIAFALERAPNVAPGTLRLICKPILFSDGQADARDWNYEDPSAEELVPDSWFILAQPVFDPDFLPDNPPENGGLSCKEFVSTKVKTKSSGWLNGWFNRPVVRDVLKTVVHRAPNMFIQHSPAVIGIEAKNLLNYKSSKVQGGRLLFMSSPKRYLWSTDPVGRGGETFWYMHLRGEREPVLLAGEVLRFIPDRELRRGFLSRNSVERFKRPESPSSRPNRPNFSRSDALIWTALSIIETASRQIPSEAWRSANPIRRRLSNVTVTFPPGWTSREFRLYYDAWSYALEVYHAARLTDRRESPRRVQRDRPTLHMTIDEAIASQFAVVYSEIHHLNDRGQEWIELYGRRRGAGQSVRVLTIDIGGGTTDTSVVEYNDTAGGAGTHLRQRTLFADSSTNAGDALLLRIVQDVLLPAIAAPIVNDPGKVEKFKRAASAQLNVNPVEDRERRMVITRTVLVPMALRLLQDALSEQWSPWAPQSLNISQAQIDQLNKIFEAAGLEQLLKWDVPLAVDFDKVKSTIHDWITPVAELHGRYLAALDCDLVIVTGKPSEQPIIKSVLKQKLPVSSDRIIFASGYYAGDWLPASASGFIPDAKMVTVLGATLIRAIRSNVLGTNWSIEDSTVWDRIAAANHWGIIANPLLRFQDSDIVLPAQQDTMVVNKIGINTVIGRTRFMKVSPEPVYRFRWKGGMSNRRVKGNLEVGLRRVTRNERREPLRNEQLELMSVSGEDDQKDPIGLNDVELFLCTLWRENEFWLDQGRFEVPL